MQLLSVFLGRHLIFFTSFLYQYFQGENRIQLNKYQLYKKYNWLLPLFFPSYEMNSLFTDLDPSIGRS